METGQADAEVMAFLAEIAHAGRREEAMALDRLFRSVTGYTPRLWGNMIGYGRYTYTYESGRSGESLATGFALRSGRFSVYIMPGYTEFAEISARLGKHKRGKACFYINKLADVDTDVLGELIMAGLDDLGQAWPVFPE